MGNERTKSKDRELRVKKNINILKAIPKNNYFKKKKKAEKEHTEAERERERGFY